MGAGNLDSRPHAYTAIALTPKLSPHSVLDIDVFLTRDFRPFLCLQVSALSLKIQFKMHQRMYLRWIFHSPAGVCMTAWKSWDKTAGVWHLTSSRNTQRPFPTLWEPVSLLPQSRADLGQALWVAGRAWQGVSFSGALPALTMPLWCVLQAGKQLWEISINANFLQLTHNADLNTANFERIGLYQDIFSPLEHSGESQDSVA